jgi:hypothetical protein
MNGEEYVHFQSATWSPVRKSDVAKNRDDRDEQEGDVSPNRDFDALITMIV